MEMVCLYGSPRKKGNSAAIADRFCETAEKQGAKIQRYVLNKLDFRGCQGCMTCKTKLDKCVLKDELAPVLDAIREADVLVMATPVYFAGVTGQLKCFLDRTFSFLNPDFHPHPATASRLTPGKKMVFIVTQGDPEENNFKDIYPLYDGIFKFYGLRKRI